MGQTINDRTQGVLRKVFDEFEGSLTLLFLSVQKMATDRLERIKIL